MTNEFAAEDDHRLRGVRWAIFATAGVIWVSCLWVPGLALFDEPRPVRQSLAIAGVLILTATYVAALYSAVTPTVSQRNRRLFSWGFAAATVLSIPLVAPVGSADFYTWAWIAGTTAGFVPLLLRGYKRWIAVVMAMAAAVMVGTVTGGSPFTHGVIAASVAGTIIVIILLPLWLWDLLRQSRAGRAAQAQLAVTEERLRFARDVHDLLGHRLTVIALKAELAARLSGTDPRRSAQEAAEVQNLAVTALAEVRQVVHGYRNVDVNDQLIAVENVLRDAGIRSTVQRLDASLPAELATQLALTLREGCTNVLRHSTAQWCTIKLSQDTKEVRMTIVNDGAAATSADHLSFGLRGMAERLASVGGTLHTQLREDIFTLTVTVPAS